MKLAETAPGGTPETVIVATPGQPQNTLTPVPPPGRQIRLETGSRTTNNDYNKTRTTAHEPEHSLDPPDTKPGPYPQLTSCSSTTRTNATEQSRAQSNYAAVIPLRE